MEDQRFYATGKRKRAVARVWLKAGNGQVTVNGRSIEEYFGRQTSQMVIRQPLELTETLERLDVTATAKGGGLSGQAGAIKHGISKALLVVDPN
ncbi:MAG: 30S ribosomal protein S9, partial [Candidatus Binatia bacterium]